MFKRNANGFYLLETHAHTKENSPCGLLTAQEVVADYYALGYRGLMITNHYLPGTGRTAAARDDFLTGYRAALTAGHPLGMIILPGLEIRFTHGKEDFLVFGLGEQDILDMPEAVCDGSVAEFHDLCQAKGWLLYQAHPYRPGLEAQPPEVLDGMEIHNGHPRQTNNNPLALAYAQAHGLRQSAGSDLHRSGDAGGAGLWVPESALSPKGLVDYLRQTPIPEIYVRCTV